MELRRSLTDTLQINVGYLCNLSCRHCHLSCGPMREEVMTLETMNEVVAYASRAGFKIADITGGAPEMNPDILALVEGLIDSVETVMIRLNLPDLFNEERRELRQLLAEKKVDIIVSFPAVNKAQLEAQRGSGVWEKSIDSLKKLNETGYGIEGTGLHLHLVSNPSGAFLPPGQETLEERFRKYLSDHFNISFNSLLAFANVPLGRFREWLERSGNYEGYIKKLSDSFNECAVDCVMCRNLVVVSWDGYLYDCDFNLAANLPLDGRKKHISQMDTKPGSDSKIIVADHCYTCTAGSGFT